MKRLFENWRKYLQEQEKRPKAILMAGSPGSGKSSALRALGLSDVFIINTDDVYERELKKAGLALDGKPRVMSRRRELENELAKYDPTSTDPDEQAAMERIKDEIAEQTKILASYAKLFVIGLNYKKAEYEKALSNGQDFILDGTAGSQRDTDKKKSQLEEAGYDVAMIYLDIELETALKRNIQRGKSGGRELLYRELEKSHAAVSKNKSYYKQLFGDNFFYVKSDGDDVASQLATLKPKIQNFFDEKQLEENDYPISSQKANKQINNIIRPSKKANAKIKLPGWKRAKANYKGSAPPGAAGG
jgi:predicted ABC-type ATPase